MTEEIVMSLTKGILATIQATPGKQQEVASFLKSGQSLVEQEPATLVWYAFQIDETTFAIFDAFADEDGRQAHLSGQVPAALGQIADDLLAGPPDIKLVDIVAVTPDA